MVCVLVFAFAICSNAQDENKANPTQVKQKNQKLKIIKREPVSNDVFLQCQNGSRNSGLRVGLKVRFHSTGNVTEVLISRFSGCDYFDKEAVRVAKKIKFKPEVKDGEAVSVVKTVEYAFGIY